MLKKSLCLSALLLSLPLPSWAMEFVDIPAGCFVMGRDANFEQGDDNELPQHKVCLSAFQMGKYEVTQAEWVAVMGSNPSEFKGRTNPVENVSWDDVQVFIKQLNKIDGGNQYRLPSEAEWEYAARAGATTTYSCGDSAGCLDGVAWYDGNSGKTTHPVGEKQPNKWGLYDTTGNVWEWTQDCWNKNYSGAPTNGGAWTSGDCGYRVNRGGRWGSNAYSSRSAIRSINSPDLRFGFVGFRLVRQP